MRLPLLLALAAMPAAASADDGVVPGTRAGDTVTYRTNGFDRLALGTGASVEVRVGPAWSVRATGPAAAFSDFRVDRDGATLRFHRRDRHGAGQPALERQMRILVTMPRIAAVALGGAGSMRIDRVDGAAFDAAVGGSGSLALGTLAAGKLDVSIGGSGRVTAAGGTADRLQVNIGGSGGFEAPALRARRAEIAVAGSGGVRARVDGPAAVSIVGPGNVDLGDGARCTTTRMGSGRVTCGG